VLRKILIFGNSGSGKSTLAKQLATDRQLAHLDLDSLAWQATTPPQRSEITLAKQQIQAFIANNDNWVIEGCYTDLLELLRGHASEIIYMNLTPTLCIENARSRPWEPHKYQSKAAQDVNLTMLLDWILQYESRDDSTGQAAHLSFYQSFVGAKQQIQKNR